MPRSCYTKSLWALIFSTHLVTCGLSLCSEKAKGIGDVINKTKEAINTTQEAMENARTAIENALEDLNSTQSTNAMV